MIRAYVFAALFLLCGVAHGARQIVTDPSPPPPGPTSAVVPGIVLSAVIPGKTSVSWTSADSANFCAGMVNLTSGYPTQYIKCQVNAVTSSANYVAAAVGAQMFWSDFTGSTTGDATSRTNSRDRLVSQISLNQSLTLAGFPGANINDTCDSSYVPAPAGTASPVLNTAGMPLATCRQAPLGLAAETYANGACSGIAAANSGLCFSVATDTTENTVGLDNGKLCPTGPAFVRPGTTTQVAILPAGTTLTTQTSTVKIAAAADGVQTVTITSAGGNAYTWPSNSLTIGSGIRLSGFVEDNFVSPGGATCTKAALLAAINDQNHIVTAFTSGATGSVSFKIASLGCTAGDIVSYTANAGVPNARLQGVWSPSCDSSATFYSVYNPTSGTTGAGTFGLPCAACLNANLAASPWVFNGPNAGKFCSANALADGPQTLANTQFPTTTSSNALGAGSLGTSCIRINVNDQGAGNALTGRPMLTEPLPQGVAVSSIFPTPNSNPVGIFSTNSVVAYNVANAKTVAIDSEWKQPCSTPVITRTGALLGVPTGAGSCNTQSRFFNGGTGTSTGQNGIDPVSSSYAALASTFQAPIIGPSPEPAPMPAPKPAPTPAPKPAPTPAPSPAPTPSPPAPLVCSYRGIYEIIPLYAPCNRYRIASGTDSDCDYNLVTLRTAGQVGQGKIARLHWEFATIAEDGLSVPTNVLARARRGCTNRFLAAPSDPTTLKTGGSSWKWQFVPWPAATSCEEVNVISQNRLSTTAFLQVPNTCDRFRYNATDGGRQRFRLRKITL
ncbi:hypothetical protein M9434_002535 [Picochlorum sp. BPE23]|nr:hypothetical protein M9434_002535 [Picochlorum sp. BPE23]